MNHAKRIVELAESIYMAEVAGSDNETVAAAAMAIRDAKTFYAAVGADEDLKDFDCPDYCYEGSGVSLSEINVASNYEDTQFEKGTQ